MNTSSFDAVAERILSDLDSAVKKDINLTDFEIIPVREEDNKNSSPVLRGGSSLGLESWAMRHIYPFAHGNMLNRNNYRTQVVEKLIPCLTGVALLHPEMSIVWNRRKELIINKMMSITHELKLTRLALSRKPKCNDALQHRRWVIQHLTCTGSPLNEEQLNEELGVMDVLADRYHSNYHAWSHRIWLLQHVGPPKLTASLNDEICTFRLSSSFVHSILHSPWYQLLAKELENSAKFVSSHVSDHSGLHHRQFLLDNILCVFSRKQLETSGQDNTDGNNYLLQLKSHLFNFTRVLKHEFYVNLYLTRLEEEITNIDLMLAIIVAELELNSEFTSFYPNHETLWCHRRYLVYKFKYVLEQLKELSTYESKVPSHFDKNGVPHYKEAKFDREDKGPFLLDSSNVMYVKEFLMKCLQISETKFIDFNMSSSDDGASNVSTNYKKWLQNVLNIDTGIKS